MPCGDNQKITEMTSDDTEKTLQEVKNEYTDVSKQLTPGMPEEISEITGTEVISHGADANIQKIKEIKTGSNEIAEITDVDTDGKISLKYDDTEKVNVDEVSNENLLKRKNIDITDILNYD